MNSDPDNRFGLFLIGIPLAGLLYCGLGIGAMVFLPIVRDRPLISGIAFILLPFAIAASIWIRASAKAYK